MKFSVNLPLHHKVQKFSSGTGSPGWSGKKGRKTVVVVVVTCLLTYLLVHGQVTIIFVVSVSLFVCAEFFSAVFDPIWIKLVHMSHVRV